MRITVLSDYALRLLMYSAAHDRIVTIEEVAESYGISRAHLMKIANMLTRGGYMIAVRGRHGGLRLAKEPHHINLGDVLRLTEPDFALVECFATGSQCVITEPCRLPKILNEALASFLSTVDKYTLADIMLSASSFPGPQGSEVRVSAPITQITSSRGRIRGSLRERRI